MGPKTVSPKGGLPSTTPKAPAGESGLVKSTATKSYSRASSGAKQGAKANTAANEGASAASPKSELNLKFRNISDKVASNGGVKNLSTAERKEIADVLGVSPEKLTSISRNEYRQLIVKFHPDRNPGNEEFASYITQILNNLRAA